LNQISNASSNKRNYSIEFLIYISFSIFLCLIFSAFLNLIDANLHQYGFVFILSTILITASTYKVVSKSALGISDPVFMLSSFLTLYTIAPLLQTSLDFRILLINSVFHFSDEEIFLHAFRFLFFNFIICFAYFLFCDFSLKKRCENPIILSIKKSKYTNGKISLVVGSLALFFTVFFLSVLAGPVETYYDNYTKYDHLPSFLRTIVSVLKRLYWGLMPILVVLLLFNFKERKYVALLLIAFLCLIDLYISKGSRINTFIIIIQAVVVYNILISRIKLGKAFLIALPFIVMMSLIELVRLSSGDIDLQELSLIPGEFNALFFPSIELFKLRELDLFPPVSELMIFKDIYYLLPFFNNPDADPMNWHWINFHPSAPVAPFTMGPIADSAFFGGWFGLFLRAIVFAANIYLLRCLILYFSSSWLALLFFSYSVSISILALKYSVFSYQEQMLKNLLPSLVVFLPAAYIIGFIYHRVKRNL